MICGRGVCLDPSGFSQVCKLTDEIISDPDLDEREKLLRIREGLQNVYVYLKGDTDLNLYNVVYKYIPVAERVGTVWAESEHDAEVLARKEFYNDSAKSIIEGKPVEILLDLQITERGNKR